MHKNQQKKAKRRRKRSRSRQVRTPQAFMKDLIEQLNLTPLEVAQSTNLEEEQVLKALAGDCSYEVRCRICGFLRKSYEYQIKGKERR